MRAYLVPGYGVGFTKCHKLRLTTGSTQENKLYLTITKLSPYLKPPTKLKA